MSEKMITLDNLETLVNNIEAEINESAESKLDRKDGIKLFESFSNNMSTYEPSTNISDWGEDLMTGDINIVRYSPSAGGDRKDMYIGAMYIANRIDNTLWWQKLYNSYNNSWYTKNETDTLLSNKQDTLTAGNNITIDANNVISATGGGNLPSSTISDSGKFLRVNSQGNAEWQTVPQAENNSF